MCGHYRGGGGGWSVTVGGFQVFVWPPGRREGARGVIDGVQAWSSWGRGYDCQEGDREGAHGRGVSVVIVEEGALESEVGNHGGILLDGWPQEMQSVPCSFMLDACVMIAALGSLAWCINIHSYQDVDVDVGTLVAVCSRFCVAFMSGLFERYLCSLCVLPYSRKRHQLRTSSGCFAG